MNACYVSSFQLYIAKNRLIHSKNSLGQNSCLNYLMQMLVNKSQMLQILILSSTLMKIRPEKNKKKALITGKEYIEAYIPREVALDELSVKGGTEVANRKGPLLGIPTKRPTWKMRRYLLHTQ